MEDKTYSLPTQLELDRVSTSILNNPAGSGGVAVFLAIVSFFALVTSMKQDGNPILLAVAGITGFLAILIAVLMVRTVRTGKNILAALKKIEEMQAEVDRAKASSN